MKNRDAFLCYGILLAAGQGKRFDPSGRQYKLLQTLPTGQTVIARSASQLKEAFPNSIAVVSENAVQIQQSLTELALPFCICETAQDGMANSLVTALRQIPADIDAVVIALADMPFVRGETLLQIRSSLIGGAEIVVPTYQGQRGNPVGFAIKYLPQLLSLQGDRGARQLLQTYPVTEIAVSDQGILRDIDVPADLIDTKVAGT
ncbi:nucleotidyltransferase family protein [Undibacterium sp. Di24W]|uniref:nucleotidyltransferase family protein n=1 Tax=Undibacterium sp. Di24W TaxID=3413033 RepID=UPI003BF13138